VSKTKLISKKKEKMLYDLVLAETKKQLKETLKLNPKGLGGESALQSITAAGQYIFKIFSKLDVGELADPRDLGLRLDAGLKNNFNRNRAEIMEAVDNILKMGSKRAGDLDNWANEMRQAMGNMQTGIKRFAGDLQDDFDMLFREASNEVKAAYNGLETKRVLTGVEKRALNELKEAAEKLEGTINSQLNIEKALSRLNNPTNTYDDLFDLAYTIKNNKASGRTSRVGRRGPQVADDAAGGGGAKEKEWGAMSRREKAWELLLVPWKILTSRWFWVGQGLLIAFSRVVEELDKEGLAYKVLNRLNVLEGAILLYKWAGAIDNVDSVVTAGNLIYALRKEDGNRQVVQRLVLARFMKSHSGLQMPEGASYESQLSEVVIAFNALNDEEREKAIKRAYATLDDVGFNRDAMLATADSPIVDGLFDAAMAGYIERTSFTRGDQTGRITVTPDSKKGFTRISNCKAITNGNIDLDKQTSGNAKKFKEYCKLSRRISPEDKVKLLEHVFRPFFDSMREAAAQVKASLENRVTK